MNSHLRISFSAAFWLAAVVAALLLAPIASQGQNTAYGFEALGSNTSGTDNSAFGFEALISNSTGTANTAIGYNALFFNATGEGNTASGFETLFWNTTGEYNTANGWEALFNTTGSYNTATGTSALTSNTTANYNTATGYNALFNNTTAEFNTADGAGALYANSIGYFNTASGADALLNNTTGYNNTANGVDTLNATTTGYENTANGVYALSSNTSGYDNTANGVQALDFNTTGGFNTADGGYALDHNTTGSSNIALGYAAGQNLTTGSNNIDIGNAGVAGEGGVIRIGTAGTQTTTYMAGIYGVLGGTGVGVHVNAKGQLYTKTSSRRFKTDIHDIGTLSDKLMKLRAVTFRYKQAAPDGTHPVEYGLIAEEVAKVYPEMVLFDKEKKPFAVDYDALTPMLLNEMQIAHRQIRDQKKEITFQRAQMASMRSELMALKQAQQQQRTALAKLTALVEASQSKAQPRQAVALWH